MKIQDEHTRPIVLSSTKADIRSFYDAYAGTWDRRFRENRSTAHFHSRRVQAFLQVAALRPSDDVLELGCGTAPYLQHFAVARRYQGVDLSDAMLQVARGRAAMLGLASSCSFGVDDAEVLASIGDGQFGVVCFFGLIEHLLDPSALFRMCHRVLKPGGRVVGVGSNALSPWYSIVSPLTRASVKHLSSDRYYKPQEIRRYLEAVGFGSFSCHFWGFIPPGDFPDWTFGPLRVAEAIAERTPLRYLSGGLAFVARKDQNQ